jgi:exonuclease III
MLGRSLIGISSQLNLADLFREAYGNYVVFHWFAKDKRLGSDCARMNYASLESALVERVIEIKYLEDTTDQARSDHAPTFVVSRSISDLKASSSSNYLQR